MTGKIGGSSIFLEKVLIGPILDQKDQILAKNVIFRILWKILSLNFSGNKLKWKIMLLLIFLWKLARLFKHNAFCKLMLSFGGWTWLGMPRVHGITNLQFHRNSFLDFIIFFGWRWTSKWALNWCHHFRWVCSGMPKVPKTTSLHYLRKSMLDCFEFLYLNRLPKVHIILLI